jgi:hypothetical protein
MQLHVNRTALFVVGGAIMVVAIMATCVFGGYGYLQLRPLPTPTLSFVDSVRATATAQASAAASQPTPTSMPSPTVEATATGSPMPAAEPTATPTPTMEPTPEPQPTATKAPSSPPAAPPPTSTPRTQSAESCRPPRNTSIIRGPYLQWVRPNAITIVWETVDEVDSMVEFGPTTGYGSTAVDCDWTAHHEVTLTSLNPSTRYHYRIRSTGQVFSEGSEDRTFKTAAAAGQTSLTFAVLGDTQSGIPAGHFDRYRNSADQDHPRSAAKIEAINPDFYLHAGDLVFNGSDLAAWDDFFHFEGHLMGKVTIFPTLGESEGNHYNYFRIFHLPNNERWYSFDYGNAHFVALQVDGYESTSPGSAQYQWLENDLAKTDKTWKIVFYHLPPYTYGPDPPWQEGRNLHPLMVKYGVDIVFNSHDRNYQRFVVDGVTYIVTGGGAGYTGKLTGGCDQMPVFMERTKHVMKITINGNTLHSVAYRLDETGSEMDPFSLTAN